jgi:hypothetical protein
MENGNTPTGGPQVHNHVITCILKTVNYSIGGIKFCLDLQQAVLLEQ